MGVPVAKGLWGGDADFGNGDDAPGGFDIGEGVDLLTAVDAEDGSAEEEEGDIGADLLCEAEAVSSPMGAVEVEGEGGKRGPVWTSRLSGLAAGDVCGELRFEADEGSDGIGGSGAEASLDGEAFFDVELDFGVDFEGVEGEFDHFPGGIAVVSGDAGIAGGEGDLRFGGRAGDDADEVVECESLIDGHQAVEAIRSWRTEAEA